MKTLVLTLAVFNLLGCSTAGKFKSKSGLIVSPPTNASAATGISESDVVTSVSLPKGSTIVEEVVSKMENTPASTRTTITLAADSVKTQTAKSSEVSIAAPRAPDQTLAIHKANNAERRIFIYASIALGIATLALVYFGLRDAAKLTGLGTAVSVFLWWALGQQILLTIGFCVLAVGTAGYFLWSDWHKRKIEGTLKATVQSVEEFSVDHPEDARELKEGYLEANQDASHKAVIKKIIPKIDQSYIKKSVSKIL